MLKQIKNKSSTFLRGIKPSRKTNFYFHSSPQQATGYSGKVLDKVKQNFLTLRLTLKLGVFVFVLFGGFFALGFAQKAYAGCVYKIDTFENTNTKTKFTQTDTLSFNVEISRTEEVSQPSDVGSCNKDLVNMTITPVEIKVYKNDFNNYGGKSMWKSAVLGSAFTDNSLTVDPEPTIIIGDAPTINVAEFQKLTSITYTLKVQGKSNSQTQSLSVQFAYVGNTVTPPDSSKTILPITLKFVPESPTVGKALKVYATIADSAKFNQWPANTGFTMQTFINSKPYGNPFPIDRNSLTSGQAYQQITTVDSPPFTANSTVEVKVTLTSNGNVVAQGSYNNLAVQGATAGGGSGGPSIVFSPAKTTYAPNESITVQAVNFPDTTKVTVIANQGSKTETAELNSTKWSYTTSFSAEGSAVFNFISAYNNFKDSKTITISKTAAGNNPPANGNPGSVTVNSATGQVVYDCTQKDPDPRYCLVNPLPVDGLTDMVLLIMRGFTMIVAIWAVLFIIIGGFRMVVAAGNEEAIGVAKKTITWAVAGLVIAMLSFSMVAIVQNFIGARTPGINPTDPQATPKK